jgi:N-acetyl-gamma-glutamyl-phosphate reductase common form
VGAAGLRVVDLSADHRLRDAAAHAAWYGPHPDPDELPRFVYGLPELAGDALLGAARIAAPGCFATALQLACLPAAEAGVLAEDTPWVVHAVTGSSVSGTRPAPGTHHPHRHGNFWAYAARGHRHLAELLQALLPCGAFPRVTFLPHSGPWVRGIHASAVLPLATRLSEDDARALYAARFRGRPFVEVLATGEPDLHRVVGSNRAALGVTVQGGMLVVSVTIDNLLKGGAGQALQAMNVSAGLPEETGLPRAALGAL